MSWWLWIILILFILSVIGNLSSNGKKSNRSRKKGSSFSNKSSKEIADEITTVAQYKSLEKKVERADEKRQGYTAYDSKSLKTEEKYEDKYQLLQEALDIASHKTLRWQFIPNFDIDTPHYILNNTYKVFSPTDYNEKLPELGGNKDDWYGLSGDEEPDEKDQEVKFLLKFRSIIENDDLTKSDKIKKVNSLTIKSKEEAETYFKIDNALTPGDQWYADILKEDGLPLAYELYKDGVKEPQDVLKIEIEEFTQRSGVGPKRLEQFKQYQEKIRAKLAHEK